MNKTKPEQPKPAAPRNRHERRADAKQRRMKRQAYCRRFPASR